MLNKINLAHLLYVTLIFISGTLTLFSQTPPNIEKQIDVLIEKLGASGFRERKQAIKDLITLGYYARSKVQNALNSNDPEVRENAQEVWNEIKNIITPHHSKEVSHFIKKLKNHQAKQGDWQNLMQLLGQNSLEVMIEIMLNVELHQIKAPARNPDLLTKQNLVKGLVAFFPEDTLTTMAKSLSQEDKKCLLKNINSNLKSLTVLEQAMLLKVFAQIAAPDESLTILPELDLLSPIVLKSIDKSWLNYYKNANQWFEQDLKFIVMHLLMANKQLTQQEVNSFITENPLSTASDQLCSIYYHFYYDSIELIHWQKLFEKSEVAWHKLALLKINNKLTSEVIKKLDFSTFKRRSQMLALIDRFFYFRDPRAIPLLEKIKNLKQDKPSDLYNENFLLLKHFSRLADFEKAQEHLLLYNKSEGRKRDTNFNFYSEQKTKIKQADIKTLQQISELHKAPEKALLLLNEVQKSSPDIATIYIQKAEIEIKLKKINDAKRSIRKASTLLPQNAIEFRQLIYLCFDIQAKDLAEELLTKLILEEENINNCIIAAGAYEYFGNRSKASEYQQMIYMTGFGQVRDLFYDQKYEQIPEKCINPDEGDFHYLWGILAKGLKYDTSEAALFMRRHSFTDNWPKTIAYMLIDKMTPDELIAECSATLNTSEQRGRLTEAYFYIACKYLKKDPNKSKRYLQKCLDLKFREYYEYISAYPVLKNLNL
ncbi:MAG: hypothetical protein MK132_12295 [Lentisphaerales bacterium]|nr:hypothetical protein [Lentisphaerales bacterium]